MLNGRRTLILSDAPEGVYGGFNALKLKCSTRFEVISVAFAGSFLPKLTCSAPAAGDLLEQDAVPDLEVQEGDPLAIRRVDRAVAGAVPGIFPVRTPVRGLGTAAPWSPRERRGLKSSKTF